MLNFKSNVILAPLAGFTDCAFRKVCDECGAGLSVTEMVSAKGLHYNNENTEYLLKTCSEQPVAVQLFGSEPEIMAEACQNEKLQKFDAIDINMGCPVPKVVKNGEGSALMKDFKKAEKIISACEKATSKPISVKFRLGFDEICCVDFAKMCENAGASFITIHGRTQKQFYSGNARYDEIFEASKAVKIPVFCNGDIQTKEDYDFIMQNSNCYGVAIGRKALGNPNIFNELLGKNTVDKISLLVKHYEYLKQNFSERYVFTNFRKHLSCYVDGTQNAKVVRNLIFTSHNIEDAVKIAISSLKDNECLNFDNNQ